MSLPLEAGGHRWENHSCRLFQSSSSRTIGCSGCPQRSHCANTRGAFRTCGATFDGGITLDDGKSENKSSDGYKYAVKAAICWLIFFDRSMVLWYIQITMFERPWQSKTGSSSHEFDKHIHNSNWWHRNDRLQVYNILPMNTYQYHHPLHVAEAQALMTAHFWKQRH